MHIAMESIQRAETIKAERGLNRTVPFVNIYNDIYPMCTKSVLGYQITCKTSGSSNILRLKYHHAKYNLK
jgi:hypothetical protein